MREADLQAALGERPRAMRETAAPPPAPEAPSPQRPAVETPPADPRPVPQPDASGAFDLGNPALYCCSLSNGPIYSKTTHHRQPFSNIASARLE